MPTRRQLIQKIELNSIASSVTFSNVPQNYTDLELEFSVRGDTNVSSQITTDAYIQFNESTSDYSRKGIYADFPSTVGTTSGSNIRGQINLPVSTSNTFASNKAYIPNYNGSQNKAAYVLSFSETNSTTGPRIENVAGLWSNTSAISSIKFTTYSGSFVANSTFYLYGITHVPIIRGGEVSIANGYKTHVFKSTSSIQVVEGGEVEFLVIAGGGPGGYGNNGYLSGGGGAGGYRSSIIGESSGGGALSEPKARLDPGKHVITVGAGGSSTSNGSPSSIGSVISTVGGGRGGSSSTYGLNGLAGGSGGGGSTASGVGGAGTSGQGYAGGNGRTGAGGGQGGGAGDTGSLRAFNGRVSAATGSQVAYASGGIDYNAIPGDPNTGNGGTGSGSTSSNYAWGGNGGSGIVVIRYPYDGN